MHALHLLRAQHPPDPQEGPPVGQPPLHRHRVDLGEDLRQFPRHPPRINHVLGLRIKRIGLHVGRQNPPVPIRDIRPRRQNLRPRRRRSRLHRLGRGQKAHPRPDGRKRRQKPKAQEHQPQLGPRPALVADFLMPQAQVLALDRVGVLALLTGGQDAGQRAERGADHGNCPSGAVFVICPVTSTGSVMAGNSPSPGRISGAG